MKESFRQARQNMLIFSYIFTNNENTKRHLLFTATSFILLSASARTFSVFAGLFVLGRYAVFNNGLYFIAIVKLIRRMSSVRVLTGVISQIGIKHKNLCACSLLEKSLNLGLAILLKFSITSSGSNSSIINIPAKSSTIP